MNYPILCCWRSSSYCMPIYHSKFTFAASNGQYRNHVTTMLLLTIYQNLAYIKVFKNAIFAKVVCLKIPVYCMQCFINDCYKTFLYHNFKAQRFSTKDLLIKKNHCIYRLNYPFYHQGGSITSIFYPLCINLFAE